MAIRRNLKAVWNRAQAYQRNGVGLGGAVLKHSLVPLEILKAAIPRRGTILDLGCGEGMLSNLIATEHPSVQVIGVDKDAKRIALARATATPNSQFIEKDVLQFRSPQKVEMAIFNDVLHHHSDEVQKELLQQALNALTDDGVLVLKEVDRNDRPDRVWTTFWDSRLYPQDRLNFHTPAEWRAILGQVGFEVLRLQKYRHPWPASRTLFMCRKRRVLTLPAKAHGNRIKCLVTGATGFIGSELVRHLLTTKIEGKRPQLYLLTRNRANITPEIAARCQIVNSDLESIAHLHDELKDCEVVFHLAAEKDFFGGARLFEGAVRGVNALIDELKTWPNLRKVIFASTVGAVDRRRGDRCETPVDENTPAKPQSLYGQSKLACENLFRDSGLPVCIARIPWVYGPAMTPMSHIRKLSALTARKSWITRFQWPGRLAIMGVEDCARALVHLAQRKGKADETFTFSDGEPLSFGELFAEMGKIAGAPGGTVALPKPVLKLLKLGAPLLPFTVRCLVQDVFWINDAKMRATGFTPTKRRTTFLLPLIREMHLTERPGETWTRAVVTGAASGIGLALARQMAGRGYSVCMVDRDPRVKELAKDLPQATALVSDLSRDADRKHLIKEVNRGNFSVLINCAGIGVRGKVGTTNLDAVERLLGVNVTSLTDLTEASIKDFEAKGGGTVVNISSSAAFQPLPGMAAYAASKAYVLNYTEAIQFEQKDSGVVVLGICPGGVDTSFQSTSGVKKNVGEHLLTSEYVAAQILEHMEKERSAIVCIGKRPVLMSLLARVLPRTVNTTLWGKMMSSQR